MHLKAQTAAQPSRLRLAMRPCGCYLPVKGVARAADTCDARAGLLRLAMWQWHVLPVRLRICDARTVWL